MSIFRKILDLFSGKKPAKSSSARARRQEPPSEDDEAEGSQEPITIFSRIADPALVARRLRELVPDVQIKGADASWTEAVVTHRKGNQVRRLTFHHDPDYYSEPNWSVQKNGMQGYFSRFPETDRKSRTLMLISTFRFSLGTIFEPDFDPKGDPRLDVLLSVAESLDAVLFTPSSLRDARGRILYGAGGEDDEDPEACWPKVAGEVQLPDPMAKAMHEISRPIGEGEEVERALAPSAARVARRAAALAAVTYRAILEQSPDDRDAEKARLEAIEWVKAVEIDDELEPDEWKVLQRPVGKLDQRSQIDSTWKLEALGVLAWALSRFEVPPHDQLVETGPLWRSLGLLDAELGRELLAEATLRSDDELRVLRNRQFALHWRVRNYSIKPEVMDFAEFARTAWFGPLDITGLSLVGGDLAIEGKRIDKASPDLVGRTHSAAMERHRAANWLWDGPERFSDADSST